MTGPGHQAGEARRIPALGGGAPSCVGPQADLFFSEDAARVERAKALCATCPSRMPCLAGALERREPWGVWGGELFHGGTVVAYRRRRGRPPKNREPHAGRGQASPDERLVVSHQQSAQGECVIHR